jgi:hypothetical protein
MWIEAFFEKSQTQLLGRKNTPAMSEQPLTTESRLGAFRGTKVVNLISKLASTCNYLIIEGG